MEPESRFYGENDYVPLCPIKYLSLLNLFFHSFRENDDHVGYGDSNNTDDEGRVSIDYFYKT